MSQRSRDWTWNYWARDSREYKTLPYPDDLDDTFCALSALWEFDQTLINGSTLAKITTVLTTLEAKVGGPYRTWVVPPDSDPAWLDVDLAVNSNVAYFLSVLGISLPNVMALIERSTSKNAYTSGYYPSPLPVIYFISRIYRGEKSRKIVDFILLKRRAGHWGNPLNTALAVTALLNLGQADSPVEGAVKYLKQSVERDHWPAASFCLDPAIKGKTYYAGSLALTTAFCLEALSRFQQARTSTIVSQRTDAVANRIVNRVMSNVRDRFRRGKPLAALARNALAKKLSSRETQAIIILPLLFKRALGKNGRKIPDELLIRLGTATLYGWLAYTIYDDFLDNEGDTTLLPVANLCLRELTLLFHEAIPESKAFQQLFQRVMDELEAANAWEVTFARGQNVPKYGDLSQLYKKSFGHALGPLAILFSLGFKERSPEVIKTISFFRHYLLARQLNDDAHDWEEDLKAGRINAVGALVLSKVPAKRILPVVPIDTTIEKGRLFWEKIIVDVCQRLLKETALARQALKDNPIIVEPAILEPLLAPIEQSAQRALTERTETRKFLRTYGSS